MCFQLEPCILIFKRPLKIKDINYSRIILILISQKSLVSVKENQDSPLLRLWIWVDTWGSSGSDLHNGQDHATVLCYPVQGRWEISNPQSHFSSATDPIHWAAWHHQGACFQYPQVWDWECQCCKTPLSEQQHSWQEACYLHQLHRDSGHGLQLDLHWSHQASNAFLIHD